MAFEFFILKGILRVGFAGCVGDLELVFRAESLRGMKGETQNVLPRAEASS